MDRGFRGRARGRAGFAGRGHGQGRAFEAVVPAVDGVDGKEIGVGHGGGILMPSASLDTDVEEVSGCQVFDVESKGEAKELRQDDSVATVAVAAKEKDEAVEDKKDGGGVALDDWSYQSVGRRGGWGDQRRGRGGFNKRGFGGGGGGRGGRGDGRGKWGRGGRGGGGGFGGYNRWSEPRDPKAGIKSGDSNDPGTSKPSSEIIEYWTDASAPRLPDVPFEYTPWETTFDVEAREFLQGLDDSREGLIRDERGIPYDDCRMSHAYGQVCQFCDGRNGPWVHKDGNPNDPAFKRYQQSILSSPFDFKRTSEEQAAARDVVKLGVEADEVAAEQELPVAVGEDFGVIEEKEENEENEEEKPRVTVSVDFGLFDFKLNLTE